MFQFFDDFVIVSVVIGLGDFFAHISSGMERGIRKYCIGLGVCDVNVQQTKL